jgi:hypothetical protein
MNVAQEGWVNGSSKWGGRPGLLQNRDGSSDLLATLEHLMVG